MVRRMQCMVSCSCAVTCAAPRRGPLQLPSANVLPMLRAHDKRNDVAAASSSPMKHLPQLPF